MRNLLIGVAVITAGQAAYGALSSCTPSTSFTTASSTTVITTGSAIPVAGSGANDFTSLAGAGGCAATDFNFSNFAGTFSGNGAGNNAGTAAGTYFSADNSLNVLTTPDQLTLSSVRGTVSVSTDGNANDGTNNWFSNSAAAAHHVDDVIGFTITDVNSNAFVSLTSLQLTLNGTEFNGTQSFTVRYCEDGSTALLSSTQGCTNSGTLHTVTLTPLTTGATAVQSQTFVLNLATPISNLNVLDFSIEIDLLGGTSSSNSGFDSIGIGLVEAVPEPATFVLMGTILAGIGFLRRRKKS